MARKRARDSAGNVGRIRRNDENRNGYFWSRREVMCNGIAMAFAICGVFIPGLMLFDRRPVLEVTYIRVEPNEVVPGELMTIKWGAREFRSGCSGTVSQQILSLVNEPGQAAQVFPYAPEPTFGHAFRSDRVVQDFTRTLQSPIGAHLGPARYRSSIWRWCNFMQEFFWQMRDPIHVADFTFVERKKNDPQGRPLRPADPDVSRLRAR
jgi:hypothetical protein